MCARVLVGMRVGVCWREIVRVRACVDSLQCLKRMLLMYAVSQAVGTLKQLLMYLVGCICVLVCADRTRQYSLQSSMQHETNSLHNQNQYSKVARGHRDFYFTDLFSNGSGCFTKS